LREVYLIARREFLAYVGAWGFWLSLIATPLIIAVLATAPLLLRGAEPTRVVTAIAAPADAALVEKALRDTEGARSRWRVVAAPAADIEGLRPYLTGEKRVTLDGEERRLFAAFVVRREGGAVRLDYWSANLTDRSGAAAVRTALAEAMRGEALASRGVPVDAIAQLQALTPEFDQFDPAAAAGAGAPVSTADRAPFMVAFALAFMLWTAVISVANMLLSSTIEEKSNKILDSLLTAATPLQILAGKLFGVAAVSFALFAFWGVFGGAALAAGAMQSPLMAAALEAALRPDLLLTFLACFAAGYLMYGALFLAIGSLCETLQEAQTLIGPLFLIMAIPVALFGPAVENPQSPAVAIASWIPVFTPFLTLVRAPAGLAPAETLGLVATMAVTVAMVLWAAAAVFRAGVSGELTMADLRRRVFRRGAEA
jgi:ABC-2 type transport system permease protein